MEEGRSAAGGAGSPILSTSEVKEPYVSGTLPPFFLTMLAVSCGDNVQRVGSISRHLLKTPRLHNNRKQDTELGFLVLLTRLTQF